MADSKEIPTKPSNVKGKEENNSQDQSTGADDRPSTSINNTNVVPIRELDHSNVFKQLFNTLEAEHQKLTALENRRLKLTEEMKNLREMLEAENRRLRQLDEEAPMSTGKFLGAVKRAAPSSSKTVKKENRTKKFYSKTRAQNKKKGLRKVSAEAMQIEEENLETLDNDFRKRVQAHVVHFPDGLRLLSYQQFQVMETIPEEDEEAYEREERLNEKQSPQTSEHQLTYKNSNTTDEEDASFDDYEDAEIEAINLQTLPQVMAVKDIANPTKNITEPERLVNSTRHNMEAVCKPLVISPAQLVKDSGYVVPESFALPLTEPKEESMSMCTSECTNSIASASLDISIESEENKSSGTVESKTLLKPRPDQIL